jgi:polyphosphate glucokinase
VSVDTGELLTERFRIPTPQPATPKALVPVMRELIDKCGGTAAVGITVPAVAQRGIVLSAANIDATWIGVDAAGMFTDELGCPATVVNDADAAGIAEMRFGAGRDRSGVVIIVTLGTGIGSAVFLDGHLLPNTELGHLEFQGDAAERYAAASVREREDLSWKAWGGRVSEYMGMLERLFSPDLFIIGGGVCRKSEKFFGYLDLNTEVVPAGLENQAGVVGAALAAHESSGRELLRRSDGGEPA